jgi:hypothetical protein
MKRSLNECRMSARPMFVMPPMENDDHSKLYCITHVNDATVMLLLVREKTDGPKAHSTVRKPKITIW